MVLCLWGGGGGIFGFAPHFELAAEIPILDQEALYMSIASLPLAKSNPPEGAAPLVPKPNVPLGPAGC
jgi:hypothetical protein